MDMNSDSDDGDYLLPEALVRTVAKYATQIDLLKAASYRRLCKNLGRKRVVAGIPNDKLCRGFAVAVSDSIVESFAQRLNTSPPTGPQPFRIGCGSTYRVK
jgi:hypothetical protein